MNSLRILAEAGFHIKYNPDFSIDLNVSLDKPIRLTLKFMEKKKMEGIHMRQHNTFQTDTKTRCLSFMLMFTCLVLSSCAGNPLLPVSSEEEQRIKAELNDRSFRQFDPSKDADKRKGVIIDFFNGVSLWAQYAEGMYALNEWEILADDYRIEKAGSEYRVYFEAPRSRQILPTPCDNCIETSGISISIQNLFDSEKIRFKLNISNDNFPRPFPIFESWTKFNEDEYFD